MLARIRDVDLPEPRTAVAATVAAELRGQAARISEQRAVPAEVVARLKQAGLLGAMRPKRFGGEAMTLKEATCISRELAAGDASTAWVHNVFIGHEFLMAMFPLEAQEAFWASADVPVCASSVMPTGRAVPADGGWRLSGSWSFCSGVDHADWILLGAIVGMLPGERPIPDRRLFLLPSSAYAIVDDWDVMGLRGTGSKSVVVDDVFVADAYVLADADVTAMTAPGLAHAPSSEYKYPAWALLSFGLVGLASRIAQNAYDTCVKDLVAGTTGRPNPLFEMRRGAAMIRLAEASAKIDAADLLLTTALDTTFDIVESGRELTLARRVRNRRDQCYAAQLALEGTTMLLAIGGARGIREGGVVQRAHRDLTALTLHPASNWDATATSFGTVTMGGAPTEAVF